LRKLLTLTNVLNATFNNISFISCWSFLLVDEIGVSRSKGYWVCLWRNANISVKVMKCKHQCENGFNYSMVIIDIDVIFTMYHSFTLMIHVPFRQWSCHTGAIIQSQMFFCLFFFIIIFTLMFTFHHFHNILFVQKDKIDKTQVWNLKYMYPITLFIFVYKYVLYMYIVVLEIICKIIASNFMCSLTKFTRVITEKYTYDPWKSWHALWTDFY
jgi:hypothetical protein